MHPLVFIENKGQFDKRARFQLKSSHKNLWLTHEGIVFDFIRQKITAEHAKDAEKLATTKDAKNTNNIETTEITKDTKKTQIADNAGNTKKTKTTKTWKPRRTRIM